MGVRAASLCVVCRRASVEQVSVWVNVGRAKHGRPWSLDDRQGECSAKEGERSICFLITVDQG
jgi:hypothetical protein